jgi:hypothetical protein
MPAEPSPLSSATSPCTAILPYLTPLPAPDTEPPIPQAVAAEPLALPALPSAQDSFAAAQAGAAREEPSAGEDVDRAAPDAAVSPCPAPLADVDVVDCPGQPRGSSQDHAQHERPGAGGCDAAAPFMPPPSTLIGGDGSPAPTTAGSLRACAPGFDSDSEPLSFCRSQPCGPPRGRRIIDSPTTSTEREAGGEGASAGGDQDSPPRPAAPDADQESPLRTPATATGHGSPPRAPARLAGDVWGSRPSASGSSRSRAASRAERELANLMPFNYDRSGAVRMRRCSHPGHSTSAGRRRPPLLCVAPPQAAVKVPPQARHRHGRHL